jgi:hypothetical protein
MNMPYINFDADDDKANALDHLRAAVVDLHRNIDVIASVRIDGGAISGRVLDNLLQSLIEIEGDLSRCEGKLIE